MKRKERDHLKRCPHCRKRGTDKRAEFVGLNVNRRKVWMVWCPNCGHYGYAGTSKEVAAKKWNMEIRGPLCELCNDALYFGMYTGGKG